MATQTTKSKRSGNPAKRPARKTWTKVRAEELELPSGAIALVKRPGPEALLQKGVLPDALAKMVTDMIATGQGMKQDDVSKLGEDPEALLGMIDAMDKVLVSVVVSPKVRYHRGIKTDQMDPDGLPIYRDAMSTEKAVVIPEEDRNEEFFYSDDVDFEDKSFIFNFAVGGTRDVARFRESLVSLGNVSDDEGDVNPAQ